MLNLAFVWHMHQPYYRDLASGEIQLPWVRLHGIKDYLDMVKILEHFPKIRQTFNLVPCLIEQIQAYIAGDKDYYQVISYKRCEELSNDEKGFILERFFSAHLKNIISLYPRYYELYLKKQARKEFSPQDYLDLQVWFNLAWFDPCLKNSIPELKRLIAKARNFSQEDKQIVLDAQIEVLKEIIPTYRKFQDSGQIEVIANPYYHPITPLLYNTNIAREANRSALLPAENFNYPEDALSQIRQAVELYKNCFGRPPRGMWPSEEAVSEHIVNYLINSGIKWIVTDEEILFRSIRKKERPNSFINRICLKEKMGIYPRFSATATFRI